MIAGGEWPKKIDIANDANTVLGLKVTQCSFQFSDSTLCRFSLGGIAAGNVSELLFFFFF